MCASDENIFMDVLVEEFINILCGKKIGQILLGLSMIPDEAWNRVAKMFNERTGKSYAKMELKKNLESMCQQFLFAQPLFEQGGFGLDFPRTMFNSGDPMRAEYKMVKPEYGCRMYEDLRETFIRRTETSECANGAGNSMLGNDNVSCPVENARFSEGCNGSFPCPDGDVKISDGCHGNISCPGDDVKISNRCDNVSCSGENVKNSNGSNDSVSCPGKNHNSNGCDNVLSPGENVQSSVASDSGDNVKNFSEHDTTSFPKENAKNSTQCQSSASDREDVKDFKKCNKRPLADPANSSPHKQNNSRFDYSKADTTSGVDAAPGSCRTGAPDCEEPYSTACCLKILNSVKGVDLHLRVAAVELFEDPDYRKFFVRWKNEKRLDWLKAICNINH